MTTGWSIALNDILTPPEVDAVNALRDGLGFDPAMAPLFWEHVIARMLGGTVTGHRDDADIDLGHFTVEVKYSRAAPMQLGPARRHVFRWTALNGTGHTKTAPVTVLVGLDVDRQVHTWVLPRSAIGTTQTVTVIAPSSSRGGTKQSGLHGYYAPAADLLDAVMCCRHHEDSHGGGEPNNPAQLTLNLDGAA